MDVVEAVTDLLQLQRSEAEWVGVVTDPPQQSVLGLADHAWKLATCRAARTTSVKSAVSMAAPMTSIGARFRSACASSLAGDGDGLT